MKPGGMEQFLELTVNESLNCSSVDFRWALLRSLLPLRLSKLSESIGMIQEVFMEAVMDMDTAKKDTIKIFLRNFQNFSSVE